ncbi:MAG: 5'-nucleotidase [Pseudomonadota bacterium]|nr:5'-nucleotidase [Pseudomonadota bacterium]
MAFQFDRLVVGISSRALFDLDASHQVYEQEGLGAYARYQIEHENDPLGPGPSFHFVRKLLNLNNLVPGGPLVEVILLSRNSADTGLRVFNSIQHHNLEISRAAFCGGEAPYRYMGPFGCQLFLSAESSDVGQALEAGVAAATILPWAGDQTGDESLRFAFDGDAVLFSDEAEQVFQAQGLDAFASSERLAANEPLSGGPFKPFLAALHKLQSRLPQDTPQMLRTALVTARSAPAHERVIRTLRAWDIRVDESLFLGGRDKALFLQAYGADIFFDDQRGHCQSASEHVATGHVPHGVTNR